MRKSLLICIAFHYNPERLKYLTEVINNFVDGYDCELDIIVDTNTNWMDGLSIHGVKFFFNENLEHPFHLTWVHRKHIKENIDNYDNFLYIEDDMLLPYENYLNYLENFKTLYPYAVPSFVRIERKDGQDYISDIPKTQQLQIVNKGGKQFHAFPFPYNYHAFWIMPAKELKDSMKSDFVKLSDGREFGAMYVGWELKKPAMVEIENGLVSKKCYSYHLPNNYALGDGENGKIKPENIFK